MGASDAAVALQAEPKIETGLNTKESEERLKALKNVVVSPSGVLHTL